ncbi:MAG: hypothetical protein K8S87_06405 [Planctomycetes bacterium]|nr:hypothetical protein [Planctomycetota bacterium]
MKSIKLQLCFILVVIALIWITNSGCHNSLKMSIRDIYNEFRAHFDNDDYEGMAAMMTENSRHDIEKLGDGDFKTGFLTKLETNKTFKMALTLKNSDAIDRALDGKMVHSPYAFEKAVRMARNSANQAESLIKKLGIASGDQKSKIQSEIKTKTSEYKALLNKAMEANGEDAVKDAVYKSMSSNENSDIVTLRDAIDKALKDSRISGLDNTGFLRFELVSGGNYSWSVVKICNEDKWLISIPK